MVCEQCRHSVTYLHRAGVLSDELFAKIIAGHNNKFFYEVIQSIESSKKLYARVLRLDPKIIHSLTP